MPQLLIQVPVLKTRGDIVAASGGRIPPQTSMGRVDLLDEYTSQYAKELVPSFMRQLHGLGVLDHKKRFTRPAYLFLDGLWKSGHELVAEVMRTKSYRYSHIYEMTTRLWSAGAVVSKTETFCLLGKNPATREKLERVTELRDVYIANRIRCTLSALPNSVGIFIIGAGHKRVELPPPMEVKVFHCAEMWPKRFLREFLDPNMQLPLCQPDDFGHAAGHGE